MVTTSPSCTDEIGVTHERRGWPLRCTVQAPHCATPQPYLVPVSLSSSRKTHSKGVSASTSTLTFLPLTEKLVTGTPKKCVAGGPREVGLHFVPTTSTARDLESSR